MTPAPRAVAALAVLALAALIVPIALVLLAVAALVAATIVDARAAKRVPRVERHAPEVLSRGVPAPLDVIARPPAGGSARVRQAAPAALALERREGDGTLRTERHAPSGADGTSCPPSPPAPPARSASPAGITSPVRRPRSASSPTCAPPAGSRSPSRAAASATKGRRRAARSGSGPSSS